MSRSAKNPNDPPPPPPQSWIRGVNLGGWLLLERYITPYQFALTTCHIQGDFCWYPGQINAPPNAPLCDIYRCHPVQTINVLGQVDYPMDEYSLWQAFGANNTEIAEEWLNYHLEYFITEQDIIDIRASGATHVRVPLAHWSLPDDDDEQLEQEESGGDRPLWIVGKRWQALQRVVHWCRQHGLQVWPDIHTAPGSQNGFDNSGRQKATPTCQGWMNHPENVQASLNVIERVAHRIRQDNMTDVITGFGLLNEPFRDCNLTQYKDFVEHGLELVRRILGPATHVYVSDLFQPEAFNNWWLDAHRYHDTYLDTHYYHVFSETTRALSPKQHIALTCQNQYHVPRKVKKTQGGIASCCYHQTNTTTSNTTTTTTTIVPGAIQRMVGEWSVAVDQLPVDLLYAVLQHVAETGLALDLDRQLSPERQAFLRHFAQAQMVIYETASLPGLSGAWFYWTAKMEGGAFAEWDYLRGIREGWIPTLPASPTISSESLYGSCYDILARTVDNASLVHEYPPPKPKTEKPQTTTTPSEDDDNWQGMALDDDIVLSHGQSLVTHPSSLLSSSSSFRASRISGTNGWTDAQAATSTTTSTTSMTFTSLIVVVVVVLVGAAIWQYPRRPRPRRAGYSALPQS